MFDCLRFIGVFTTFAAAVLLTGTPANAYSETFIHLRADPAPLDRFVVDLYAEDEDYEVSFVETLAVERMALVVKSGPPNGLDPDALADGDRGVLVQLRVGVTPSDTRPDDTALFGDIFCRGSAPPQGYDTKERGLLCLSAYDAGDAGEFFVVPRFSDNGTLEAAQVYFSVESQKVKDREGTPDGDPFVGALLNGRGLSVDQSIADFSETFANARPIVRLRESGQTVTVKFTDAPVPTEAD